MLTTLHGRRRRGRGQGGTCLPKFGENIFWGQLLCKIRAFSGKVIKFSNFVNFSGKYNKVIGYFGNFSDKNHLKFGHFVNFSYIFVDKNNVPPEVD